MSLLSKSWRQDQEWALFICVSASISKDYAIIFRLSYMRPLPHHRKLSGSTLHLWLLLLWIPSGIWVVIWSHLSHIILSLSYDIMVSSISLERIGKLYPLPVESDSLGIISRHWSFLKKTYLQWNLEITVMEL